MSESKFLVRFTSATAFPRSKRYKTQCLNESSSRVGTLTPESALTSGSVTETYPSSSQPGAQDGNRYNLSDVKRSLAIFMGSMGTSDLRQEMVEVHDTCMILTGYLKEIPESTLEASGYSFVAKKLNEDLTIATRFLDDWSRQSLHVQLLKRKDIQIQVREIQEDFGRHVNEYIAISQSENARVLAKFKVSEGVLNNNRPRAIPEQIVQADEIELNQQVLAFTGHTPDASYILKKAISHYEQPARHHGDIFNVFKGWLKDGDEAIAVKMYRRTHKNDEEGIRAVERILRQVQLWTSFNSPFILDCYGMSMQVTKVSEEQDVYDEFQLYLVSPWKRNRDAVQYLKELRGTRPHINVLRYIQQAALGIKYLHHHDPPCVHAGIRGENVIIDDDGNVRLNGFGFTKASPTNVNIEPECMKVTLYRAHSESKQIELTGDKFQVRWMAPELLTSPQPALDPPCDVWSWAMTALELTTGQTPYYNIKGDYFVQDAILEGIIPQRDDYPMLMGSCSQPDKLWALFEGCWAKQAKDRLSIDEVVLKLEEIEKLQIEQQNAPHDFT